MAKNFDVLPANNSVILPEFITVFEFKYQDSTVQKASKIEFKASIEKKHRGTFKVLSSTSKGDTYNVIGCFSYPGFIATPAGKLVITPSLTIDGKVINLESDNGSTDFTYDVMNVSAIDINKVSPQIIGSNVVVDKSPMKPTDPVDLTKPNITFKIPRIGACKQRYLFTSDISTRLSLYLYDPSNNKVGDKLVAVRTPKVTGNMYRIPFEDKSDGTYIKVFLNNSGSAGGMHTSALYSQLYAVLSSFGTMYSDDDLVFIENIDQPSMLVNPKILEASGNRVFYDEMKHGCHVKIGLYDDYKPTDIVVGYYHKLDHPDYVYLPTRKANVSFLQNYHDDYIIPFTSLNSGSFYQLGYLVCSNGGNVSESANFTFSFVGDKSDEQPPYITSTLPAPQVLWHSTDGVTEYPVGDNTQFTYINKDTLSSGSLSLELSLDNSVTSSMSVNVYIHVTGFRPDKGNISNSFVLKDYINDEHVKNHLFTMKIDNRLFELVDSYSDGSPGRAWIYVEIVGISSAVYSGTWWSNVDTIAPGDEP
ncbi:TPA: hypothetical protein G8S59_004003 [Salmonella enterica]|uniref:Uncharacterized protein n=1 Tax=Salmonella enterica TaxID=28901 RepID=A0A756YCN9_SALER|nr:hypothetical protein [Salmonella enterica]